MQDFFEVFLFVAPFFLSFASYRGTVGTKSGSELLNHGKALVNALLLSKIVLLAWEAANGRPLVLTIRLYWPEEAILTGTCRPPALERLP